MWIKQKDKQDSYNYWILQSPLGPFELKCRKWGDPDSYTLTAFNEDFHVWLEAEELEEAKAEAENCIKKALIETLDLLDFKPVRF